MTSAWKSIDKQWLRSNGKRSWIKYEDALNETLTDNFTPTRDELKPHGTIDDDKKLFQYRSLRNIPIDEESGLARQHHTKVNRKGFNWQVGNLLSHQKKWQEHLLKQQAELVTQVSEATKNAEKAKKKKEWKSKKTKSH